MLLGLGLYLVLGGILTAVLVHYNPEPEAPEPQVIVSASFPFRVIRETGAYAEFQPGGEVWEPPPLLVVKEGGGSWDAKTDAVSFRDESFGEIRLRRYGDSITFTAVLDHPSCKGTLTQGNKTRSFQGALEGELAHNAPMIHVTTRPPCLASFTLRPGGGL